MCIASFAWPTTRRKSPGTAEAGRIEALIPSHIPFLILLFHSSLGLLIPFSMLFHFCVA